MMSDTEWVQRQADEAARVLYEARDPEYAAHILAMIDAERRWLRVDEESDAWHQVDIVARDIERARAGEPLGEFIAWTEDDFEMF